MFSMSRAKTCVVVPHSTKLSRSGFLLFFRKADVHRCAIEHVTVGFVWNTFTMGNQLVIGIKDRKNAWGILNKSCTLVNVYFLNKQFFVGKWREICKINVFIILKAMCKTERQLWEIEIKYGYEILCLFTLKSINCVRFVAGISKYEKIFSHFRVKFRFYFAVWL